MLDTKTFDTRRCDGIKNTGIQTLMNWVRYQQFDLKDISISSKTP